MTELEILARARDRIIQLEDTIQRLRDEAMLGLVAVERAHKEKEDLIEAIKTHLENFPMIFDCASCWDGKGDIKPPDETCKGCNQWEFEKFKKELSEILEAEDKE